LVRISGVYGQPPTVTEKVVGVFVPFSCRFTESARTQFGGCQWILLASIEMSCFIFSDVDVFVISTLSEGDLNVNLSGVAGVAASEPNVVVMHAWTISKLTARLWRAGVVPTTVPVLSSMISQSILGITRLLPDSRPGYQMVAVNESVHNPLDGQGLLGSWNEYRLPLGHETDDECANEDPRCCGPPSTLTLSRKADLRR
jgi:hypothetical protein